MGRHTGYFIVALVAGLAISSISSRTDGRRLASQTAEKNETEAPTSAVSEAMPEKETVPDSTVVLNSLRPDSLLIIGSLDTSGAPHQIRIDVAGKRGVEPTASAPTVPLHSAVLTQSVPQVHLVSQKTNRDASILPEVSQQHCRRSFRVPRFEDKGTRRELCEAFVLASSPRVSVYLEESLDLELDRDVLRSRAQTICQLLENQILALIHESIGPVSDVDGDQTLSIVIADLDRHPTSKSPPVRGCVTDQDFQLKGDSDFSGDVIYLDHELPEGTALASLLAHELTHAAILSYLLEQQLQTEEQLTTDASGAALRPTPVAQIPSWLNEAAAHWMEHRLTPEVPGFAERMAFFKENSAISPVVASDDYLTFTSRRSGSRAAGYLFLKSLLKSDEQLREFVLNDLPLEARVERFTGLEFREVFRNWMVEAAGVISPTSLATTTAPASGTQTLLYGTSVISIRVPGGAESISISSDSAAELEVIVR